MQKDTRDLYSSLTRFEEASSGDSIMPQQKDIKEQPGALLHSCLTTLQVNVALEHPPIVVI